MTSASAEHRRRCLASGPLECGRVVAGADDHRRPGPRHFPAAQDSATSSSITPYNRWDSSDAQDSRSRFARCGRFLVPGNSQIASPAIVVLLAASVVLPSRLRFPAQRDTPRHSRERSWPRSHELRTPLQQICCSSSSFDSVARAPKQSGSGPSKLSSAKPTASLRCPIQCWPRPSRSCSSRQLLSTSRRSRKQRPISSRRWRKGARCGSSWTFRSRRLRVAIRERFGRFSSTCSTTRRNTDRLGRPYHRRAEGGKARATVG